MNYACTKIDVKCIFVYPISTDNSFLLISHDPKCLIYVINVGVCRFQHTVKVTMLGAHYICHPEIISVTICC
jgi:hypothetical protein